jgi:rhodanese-related sulfurtransferase
VQSFFRRSTPEISIDELDTLMRVGDVRVLDVREDWEYRRGRVPGALHVPLAQLAAQLADLPRDKRILVICESGSRSLAATDLLLRNGFEETASVRGGTSAWAHSRRPLERDGA